MDIYYGLHKSVVDKLEELFVAGKLSFSELDERTLEALKSFSVDCALTVLKEFMSSKLDHVSNKSAYLCGIMKLHKQNTVMGTVSSKEHNEDIFNVILDKEQPNLDDMDVDFNFEDLEDYGLDESVVDKLGELFAIGKISFTHLDKRTLEALKECPVEKALIVLKEFMDSSLKHVSNKSAYLCGIMKTHSKNSKICSTPDAASIKSDEETCNSISDTTIPNWNAMDVDSNFKVFEYYRLSESIVTKLEEIFTTGRILLADIDERILQSLKDFPVDSALTILKEFMDSDLKNVSNKSAYLCGIMKLYCQGGTPAVVSKRRDKEKCLSTSDITPPHWDDKYADSKCKELADYGLNEKVVTKLRELCRSRMLSFSDLDKRVLDDLKKFPADRALTILKECKFSNLQNVSNKSAYLCGVMKTHHQKVRMHIHTAASKRSGKEIIGDILYKRPYNWKLLIPGNGGEVFVAKIPTSMLKDELIYVFEKCGQIWDFRLLMDHLTGQNRGYAIIKYYNRESAKAAVEQLNNYEIRRGHNLKVTISVSKLRLFVGNIPKGKSKEEIFEEFRKITVGLTKVIIYKFDDKRKNSGFCFLEYESYKAASLAKRKLGTSRVRVWGCDVIVD